jgi:hypothetical protein
MKNALNEVWNTKTNTNKGIYDINKEVEINACTHNWEDWPYEQGAIHVVFFQRDDFAILPERAFNTHPCNINNNSFVLHNIGGRNDEGNMIRMFTEINNKLNVN